LHVANVEEGRIQLEKFIEDLRREDVKARAQKHRPDVPDGVHPPESEGRWGGWFDQRVGWAAGPRVGGSEKVKYRVGSVIRHRRYGYEGMIIGWDTKCMKGDSWINQMQVDDLPGGREQSFYDVV
jgi:hypothetical protein